MSKTESLPEVERDESLTASLAVEAIAWGRAPRHGGSKINRRVVCADDYRVSVQASDHHYANDSHPPKGDDSWPPVDSPYWRGLDAEPVYPFTTFEVGYPTGDPTPAEVWDEWESGGVWAWVPRQAVADLLDAHGGAVGWEVSKERRAVTTSKPSGTR